MNDDRSENPFGASPGSASAPEPASGPPFASDNQPSIGHLLMWGICVAVFLSAYRTVTLGRDDIRLEGPRMVFFGLSALVSGANLAVIPLAILRWCRSRKFPRSGGEFLWILGAITTLQILETQLGHTLFERSYLAYRALRALTGVFIWLPAFVWAIYATRSHWRGWFIFLMAAACTWYIFEGYASLVPKPYNSVAIPAGRVVRQLVIIFALALTVWLDHRRTDYRYSWTHWTGILLCLAHNVVAILSYVYYLVEFAVSHPA